MVGLILAPVALEDTRLHGAHHLFGGGGDGAVAEGLQRQDGERLLDLDANLLDAEEEEGNDELRRNRGPMVPPTVSKQVKSASLEAARSSSCGGGWALSGWGLALGVPPRCPEPPGAP